MTMILMRLCQNFFATLLMKKLMKHGQKGYHCFTILMLFILFRKNFSLV